jgi:hypothetical protein
MRITAFRTWFSNAVQSGVGAARKAGTAISRRIREATGKVEAGVGVGDDESSFGGGRGSRAWFEFLEDVVKKIRSLFEKSKFERRYVRVEAFLRKLLGLPPRVIDAPKLPPPKRPTGPPRSLPKPMSAEESARMRQQIQMGRIQANATKSMNLRDQRRKKVTAPEDDES